MRRGAPAPHISVAWSGPSGAGERAPAPLRAPGAPISDTIAPEPYPDLFSPVDPDEGPTWAISSRALFLDALDDAMIDVIVWALGRAILGPVTDPLAQDETRIDRWLCAVRLAKTRPLATRLCEGGHVLVNGSPAKPSTKVRTGDRVEALIADRKRIVEVLRPIESRVGAAVAAICYVDHSPPVVSEAGPTIMLARGEGRPSKRLRRELDRLRRGAGG